MLENMIPIVLTPFHPNGSIDVESIPVLTHFYRTNGASALIALGIMGEAHALSDREREQVIELYVRAAGDQLPVVATISAPATEVAIDRARRAKELGARALMVAPPPGVTRTALLRAHFERIARACDLPWILQDEPVTTGVKLSPETIIDLAQAIPTLAAVKIEDVPTPSKIHTIHQAYPELKLFGGLGGLYLLEELTRGAEGSMTGFSYPNLLANILATFKAGDPSAAQTQFFRYLPLIRYEAQLGVRGIAIRKALFYQRGLITSPTVRAPAEPADPIIAEDLSRLVATLGLNPGPV